MMIAVHVNSACTQGAVTLSEIMYAECLALQRLGPLGEEGKQGRRQGSLRL